MGKEGEKWGKIRENFAHCTWRANVLCMCGVVGQNFAVACSLLHTLVMSAYLPDSENLEQ